MLKSIKIKEHLYWVGVFDYDLRTFDIVMNTPYGTSYNSYLLKTEKGNVLFETVKMEFTEDGLQQIEDVIGSEGTIDYIVLNHTEPDHSGALVTILERYPDATIIATPAALNNIKYIGHIGNETKTINTAKTPMMDFGNYHLHFLLQPYLHWPDTMMTVIPELHTVVSCDFLGCHYAEPKVLDENVVGKEKVMKQMYKLYFDSVMSPFKEYVLKGIEKIETSLGFPVDQLQYVCCSHGPVLHKNIQTVITWYKEWAQPIPLKNKVIIVYGSAYGYTKRMAEKIMEGVQSTGCEVILIDIAEVPLSHILEEFSDAKGLLLGSPTIVGDALPHFHQLLSYLNPIIHSKRFIQCFGSYGWSGEGVKNITDRIRQLKVKEINKPLTCRFKPDSSMEKECFIWGQQFAHSLLSK